MYVRWFPEEKSRDFRSGRKIADDFVPLRSAQGSVGWGHVVCAVRKQFVRNAKYEVDGGVAQLGERLNGIQEVRGSIPLTSIPTPSPIRLRESLFCDGGKTAGIAQLVEHNLAKVGVAGSSPVSRFSTVV